MVKVCVIANLLLLTKNDIIVHYDRFLNLGVYHANFPNLKGPRLPSQNCKKISLAMLSILYRFHLAPKDMARRFLVVVILVPCRGPSVGIGLFMRKKWGKHDDFCWFGHLLHSRLQTNKLRCLCIECVTSVITSCWRRVLHSMRSVIALIFNSV